MKKLLPGVLAAFVLALPGAAQAAKPVTIKVLSTRADLVSGGDALVRVTLPAGVKASSLKLTAGKRNVTHVLHRMSSRTLEGLVTRLPNRRTALVARSRGAAARLYVTNHPNGGPIFAGPQLKPWTCQAGAKDAKCDQPPSFRFVYKSTDGSAGFKDYDPKNPPGDVARTTTDKGVKVPFIVRTERGYIDRDQYEISTLFQPGKKWAATSPQKQFDHKLLITHGVSCGVDHVTGTAPSTTNSGVSIAQGVALNGDANTAAEAALGRGYAVMSNALDYSGHNCNVALQAESLQMTKEHLIDRYGTLRYTIGTGCSGGSLAEQQIANAYPGIYQGILPTCSFPDAWSTATQFMDYHQTLRYFSDPTLWAPGVVWTEQQMAQVQGHISITNSKVSDSAQFHVAVPTDPCKGVTDQQRYDPNTNPGGVRCDIQDAAINLLAPRLPDVWTPQEKQIGHGFAGLPMDNVGVQYGLAALKAGEITPAQFVDLNQKIGGLTVDVQQKAQRLTADEPALRNAYRTGLINETNNLNRTAVIDCRGPDPGAFHDAYRAFALRARLDREHGNHANQLIWEGPELIAGDTHCEYNSFLAMDRWLSSVEKDKKPGTVARKVARDKPADLTDRCYDGNGDKLTDDLCGQAVVPTYGTPRTVAGDAITTDHNKCRLKPFSKSDYGTVAALFTGAQLNQLEQLFAGGVCDFSKAAVAQQKTIPWLTYQNAKGKVVYGGRKLPSPPTSHRLKLRR
jgi:hypothetical protein